MNGAFKCLGLIILRINELKTQFRAERLFFSLSG